ncbi:diacylglycerol acyltransferase-domain-containing protein [Chytriomyces sp. MP71]|nr:diacylglycerol acyltransferase-domain-containing protein [Chytriomyces sp. MP71]
MRVPSFRDIATHFFQLTHARIEAHAQLSLGAGKVRLVVGDASDDTDQSIETPLSAASSAATVVEEVAEKWRENDDKSEPVVSDSDQEEWTDTLAVALFVAVTLGLMVLLPLASAFALLLLPSKITLPFATAYVAWIVWDWRSCERGGWGSICGLGRILMDRPVWNHYRKYFRASLIKTAELPSDRNYILAGHPHGLYCLGLFSNILSNQSHFESLFPGIKVTSATLPVNFWLPGWREFMLSLGFVSCERHALNAVVEHPSSTRNHNRTSKFGSETRGGRALFIAVGGAEEFLLMEPGTMDLVILKRKGFVKMAMMTGSSLVPVITFGENDYVDRIDTPFTRALAEMTQWVAHFAFPVFEGRWGTAFPRRARLVTVVGEPLHTELIHHPSETEVNLMHARYLQCLQHLYERHKDDYFDHRKREMSFVK